MIAENSPNSIRNMLSWFSSASTQQTEPPTNGYIPHPLGRAYVTISPCKGDFRYRFIDQPGDFSDMSCRRAVGSGSLSFGPNNANCIIDVNRRYYINIIFATVSDGINVDDDNLNILQSKIHVCLRIIGDMSLGLVIYSLLYIKWFYNYKPINLKFYPS